MDFRWDIIVDYAPLLLKGTLLTIGFSIASIIIGTILGLFIGLGKMMKKGYIPCLLDGILTFSEAHR